MRYDKVRCRVITPEAEYEGLFHVIEHELGPATPGFPAPLLWGGIVDVATSGDSILSLTGGDVSLELEDDRAGIAHCLRIRMEDSLTQNEAPTHLALLYVAGVTDLVRPA